jgi:hypothetical protein
VMTFVMSMVGVGALSTARIAVILPLTALVETLSHDFVLL